MRNLPQLKIALKNTAADVYAEYSSKEFQEKLNFKVFKAFEE